MSAVWIVGARRRRGDDRASRRPGPVLLGAARASRRGWPGRWRCSRRRCSRRSSSRRRSAATARSSPTPGSSASARARSRSRCARRSARRDRRRRGAHGRARHAVSSSLRRIGVESAQICHRRVRLEPVASTGRGKGNQPPPWVGVWRVGVRARDARRRRRTAQPMPSEMIPRPTRPLRERGLGQDLDAVRVAQEPLEVDEDARADGGDLLEPREVEERDPRRGAPRRRGSARPSSGRSAPSSSTGPSSARRSQNAKPGAELDRAALAAPAEREAARRRARAPRRRRARRGSRRRRRRGPRPASRVCVAHSIVRPRRTCVEVAVGRPRPARPSARARRRAPPRDRPDPRIGERLGGGGVHARPRPRRAAGRRRARRAAAACRRSPAASAAAQPSVGVGDLGDDAADPRPPQRAALGERRRRPGRRRGAAARSAARR